MKLKTAIGEDWFDYLSDFLKSKKFIEIQQILSKKLDMINSALVPNIEEVFNPFFYCRLKDLKVVMINDCPIKEIGANDGLAFSTNRLSDIPKETEEFFDGVEQDAYEGFQINKSFDYKRIAEQGVLMLNYSMTLSRNQDLEELRWIEHYELWQPFIYYLIEKLCQNNKGLIFFTFGKKPREFAELIFKSSHYYFPLTHPRDAIHFAQQWDTVGAFSLTNLILKNNNNIKIQW